MKRTVHKLSLRLLRGCLLVLLAICGSFMMSNPAFADSGYSGNCVAEGYTCMFYDDYTLGAHLGNRYNVPDFANPKTYFPANCTYGSDGNPTNDCRGQGAKFWNDIASAENCDSNFTSTIWYNQNYSGPSVTMGNATTPYFYVSLQSTRSPLWNNNRALSFNYGPGPVNSNSCLSRFRD